MQRDLMIFLVGDDQFVVVFPIMWQQRLKYLGGLFSTQASMNFFARRGVWTVSQPNLVGSEEYFSGS